MINRKAALAQSLLVAAFFAAPSLAADDEALKRDMTSVIALQVGGLTVVGTRDPHIAY